MEIRCPSPAHLLLLLLLGPWACSEAVVGPEASGGRANGGGAPLQTGGATASGGTPSGGTPSEVGGAALSGGASPGGSGGSTTGSVGGGGSGGLDSGGASSGTGGKNFMDNYPQGPTWEATSYRVGALCGNSICHNGLELFSLMEDEHLHETLLTRQVEQCGGVPLVDPGNPDGSALLMLTTRKCGDFVMPDGCGQPICMPEYWVPELTAWIQNGATTEAVEE